MGFSSVETQYAEPDGRCESTKLVFAITWVSAADGRSPGAY